MSRKDKVAITIKLEPEIIEELKKEASLRYMTMTGLIRQFILDRRAAREGNKQV